MVGQVPGPGVGVRRVKRSLSPDKMLYTERPTGHVTLGFIGVWFRLQRL